MRIEPESLLPTLHKDIQAALRQWYAADEKKAPLAYLYLYRRLQRQSTGNPRRVTNQLLLQAIESLRTTHENEARFLQSRFLERRPIHQLANQLNIAESTVYVAQRQAIERLTELIRTQEEEASVEQKRVLLQRLEPATYTDLFGVEEQLDALTHLISTPGAPWLIAIEGIGGIGKTALADALVRRLIREGRADEVAWVSARQQRLNLGGALDAVAKPALNAEALLAALAEQLLPGIPPSTGIDKLLLALQAHLQATPHLILVDNLETLVDIESLVPTLQTLVNPTKFVLTSRRSLYSEPNIHHLRLPELSESAALHLIRQEARLRNLPELAAASDADLRPIFATVGGNPLALRLVVGQTHLYTLPSILYELQQARGQPAENLYEFIYRRAWENLDLLSRQALLTLPLGNPGGDDIEYLSEVGDLSVDELRTALSKLVTLNLVDARGGLQERRYSIHSLTRTFLQEQVAKWF